MGKKPRTKKNAPGAETGVGHNSGDEETAMTADEQRALFLRHRDGYSRFLAPKKAADADLKNYCKKIKADGFTVDQVKVAIAVAEPDGDERERAKVAQALQAAAWAGAPWGSQLDLFNEPDRTPGVDRAYDEGKQAGMEGRVRMPPYAPELPQYEKWMDGYYAGQEALLSTGIKPPADAQPN